MRSPIDDPQPGDVIRQRLNGMFITVTKRDGDRVWWQAKTPKGKKTERENSWCVDGWKDFVCEGATIVIRADKALAGEGE